jgi:hypothetical protein
MTHKSPYAWPSPPARAPQLTGRPGKLPARFRARRALKLAAVASVWVTGLAVVVIAVAMVAMTTAPSARTGQAASAGFTASAAAGRATGQTSHAGQPAPHARAIQPARPAVTSLVFSGQGSANTTPFAIGGEGRWKVAWSYDCGGQAPGFVIRQTPAPAGAAGLTVTRTSAAGQGVAWADRDPGQHALRIRTACAWHLAVTSYS